MKYLTQILILAFIMAAPAQAQRAEADSLLRLAATSSDTMRVMHLIDVADLFKKSDPDTSIRYAAEALNESVRLRFTRGIAVAHNFLGLATKNKGEYRAAIVHYLASAAAWRSLGSKAKEASVLVNAGNAYKRLDISDSALYYQLLAMRMRERIGDSAAIANSCKATGDVYTLIGQHEKCLGYYLRAQNIHRELNDSAALASITSDIGLLLYELSRYTESVQTLDQALKIYEALGDREGIGFVYNNMALSYQRMERYTEALKYYEQALRIKEELGEKRPVAVTLFNIGNTYFDMGNFRSALQYLNNSLDIGIATGSMQIKQSCYEMLARCYESLGDHKQAYRFHTLFSTMKDSVLNRERADHISELEARYESEKKDLEISRSRLELENANLEIRQKRTQVIATIGAALLLIAIGAFIYNRHRLRQKAKFDAELIREQALRNKAIIEAEEKERVRIARDLHDGVGQQLSAVKMTLSAFEASIGSDDERLRNEKLGNLMHLVDESVREIRSVSHSMLPNALLRSGLSAAVREFVNRISAADALKVDLQIVGLLERLDSTHETVLYRVLQECVSNIVRHANATQVAIQLIRHEDRLNMMIEDNGNGFDTSQISSFSGIGVRNIVSRIEFLNGTVEFDSTPGKGTTVIIDIPLKSQTG